MDWTHVGRDEGRGVIWKKSTFKKSSKMLNETRFSKKNLLLSFFKAINKIEALKCL